MQHLNLKEIERKAFRSFYQDGLLDILFGLYIIALGITMYRPETGYSPFNIIVMVCLYTFAGLLFWAGKKYLTLPRLGTVIFGAKRRKKRTTLSILMGIIVLLQAGFVAFSVYGWLNPGVGQWLGRLLGGANSERILVASIAAFFVGPSLLLIAFFTDFVRGYYIAPLFSLAVFIMFLTNQPLYPVAIGLVIIIPGIVLLIRFLRTHSLSPSVDDERQ